MTLSEQRRDTGVIFENSAAARGENSVVARQAESQARREDIPPAGRERSRDAGVNFEGAGIRAKPEAKAPAAAAEQRVPETPPAKTQQAVSEGRQEAAYGVRSHDAGVVFENDTGAVEKPEPVIRGVGTVSGLLYSMAGLGGAATKFTMDQMGYAFRMMTDPLHALGHMQQSIDRVSTALMHSIEGEKTESESKTL